MFDFMSCITSILHKLTLKAVMFFYVVIWNEKHFPRSNYVSELFSLMYLTISAAQLGINLFGQSLQYDTRLVGM